MISDDDLILYYYRDGLPPDERASIAAKLADDPELAKRFHSLTRRLDEAAAAPAREIPVPMKYQRRWAAALEEKRVETPKERIERRRGVFANYALAYAKYNKLHIPLLSDFEPKGEVARSYGVYRKKDGVSERALFVIDEQGIIRWSYVSPIGVNPGADGVFDALEELDSQKAQKGAAA